MGRVRLALPVVSVAQSPVLLGGKVRSGSRDSMSRRFLCRRGRQAIRRWHDNAGKANPRCCGGAPGLDSAGTPGRPLSVPWPVRLREPSIQDASGTIRHARRPRPPGNQCNGMRSFCIRWRYRVESGLDWQTLPEPAPSDTPPPLPDSPSNDNLRFGILEQCRERPIWFPCS
jgi:hypothetical protein